IGEAGLLTGQRAYADPLAGRGHSIAHDAVFERPGLVVQQLEVQIAVINPRLHQPAECSLQLAGIDAGAIQQRVLGDVECVCHDSRVACGCTARIQGCRTVEPVVLRAASASCAWPASARAKRWPMSMRTSPALMTANKSSHMRSNWARESR